jgi:hypothetical protein
VIIEIRLLPILFRVTVQLSTGEDYHSSRIKVHWALKDKQDKKLGQSIGLGGGSFRLHLCAAVGAGHVGPPCASIALSLTKHHTRKIDSASSIGRWLTEVFRQTWTTKSLRLQRELCCLFGVCPPNDASGIPVEAILAGNIHDINVSTIARSSVITIQPHYRRVPCVLEHGRF